MVNILARIFLRRVNVGTILVDIRVYANFTQTLCKILAQIPSTMSYLGINTLTFDRIGIITPTFVMIPFSLNDSVTYSSTRSYMDAPVRRTIFTLSITRSTFT